MPDRSIRTPVRVALIVVGVFILAPLLAMLLSPLLTPDYRLGLLRDLWQTSGRFVMPGAIARSVGLALCVGLISTVIGTILAFVVQCARLKGLWLLKILIVMPIIVPPYIVGIAWLEIWPATRWLTSTWGLGGLFVCSLTPYAFLLMRSASLRAASLIDAGLACGRPFLVVIGELVVPALGRSGLLAMTVVGLEVFADFGAARLFGITTLSTYIVDLWVGKQLLAGAMILSILTSVGLGAVLWIGARLSGHSPLPVLRYTNPSLELSLPIVWVVWLVPIGLTSLSFGGPLVVFITLATHWHVDMGFVQAFADGLKLSLTLVLLTSLMGIFTFCCSLRYRVGLFQSWVGLMSLGYLLPPVTLALGVLVASILFLRVLEGLWGVPLTLSAPFAVLVWACFVRFVALSMRTANQAALRIPRSVVDAMRLLPYGRRWSVLLSQYRSAAFVGVLIVAIEVLKELPLTFLLAPPGFVTPAMRLFAAANGEQMHQVAIDGILLLVLGGMQFIGLSWISSMGLSGWANGSDSSRLSV